ncbi:hypothetical protein ACLOJK_017388 [Asimina triloba]
MANNPKMVAPEGELPQIAVLGAGIFVRSQYIPRLKEAADVLVLKTIWSRSEESARAAVELARASFPDIQCKWGEPGLHDIIHDKSIRGVAVVLAGQTQPMRKQFQGTEIASEHQKQLQEVELASGT